MRGNGSCDGKRGKWGEIGKGEEDSRQEEKRGFFFGVSFQLHSFLLSLYQLSHLSFFSPDKIDTFDTTIGAMEIGSGDLLVICAKGLEDELRSHYAVPLAFPLLRLLFSFASSFTYPFSCTFSDPLPHFFRPRPLSFSPLPSAIMFSLFAVSGVHVPPRDDPSQHVAHLSLQEEECVDSEGEIEEEV